MKKIYWSALAFSLGVPLGDYLMSIFLHTEFSFETSFKVAFSLLVFAFMNRHLEADKEKLDEAIKISEQLSREILRLDKSINQSSASEKEMEKEFNFFTKKN